MAEQDNVTAGMELRAQGTRNTNIVQMAEAQASAAKKLLEAEAATRLQNELEVRLIQARATYAMATNWNGQLPANILPADSPLLMNLGVPS